MAYTRPSTADKAGFPPAEEFSTYGVFKESKFQYVHGRETEGQLEKWSYAAWMHRQSDDA